MAIDEQMLSTIVGRAHSGTEGINQAVAAVRSLQDAARTCAEIDKLAQEIRTLKQEVIGAKETSTRLTKYLSDSRREVEDAKNLYLDRGNVIAEMEGVVAEWKSDRVTMRQQVLELQIAMRDRKAPDDLIEKCSAILGIA